MNFYESFVSYYDEIFPGNPKQIQFITSYMKKESSILDVGAGTGNTALELAKRDYQVTAIEPEKTMLAKIADKATLYPENFHFDELSMEQLNQLQGNYDGIYCVGNTLVHLLHIDEIHDFLQKAFQQLKEHGTLLIQIVNYEKENFRFPVIKKEGFTFERQYAREEGKVLFTTTLTTEGTSQSSTTTLYPLTVNQLLPLLEDVGFHSLETYGNFEKTPYSKESPALIVVAKK